MMKHKIFPPPPAASLLSPGRLYVVGGVTVSECGYNWVVIGLLIGGRALGKFGC